MLLSLSAPARGVIECGHKITICFAYQQQNVARLGTKKGSAADCENPSRYIGIVPFRPTRSGGNPQRLRYPNGFRRPKNSGNNWPGLAARPSQTAHATGS